MSVLLPGRTIISEMTWTNAVCWICYWPNPHQVEDFQQLDWSPVCQNLPTKLPNQSCPEIITNGCWVIYGEILFRQSNNQKFNVIDIMFVQFGWVNSDIWVKCLNTVRRGFVASWENAVQIYELRLCDILIFVKAEGFHNWSNCILHHNLTSFLVLRQYSARPFLLIMHLRSSKPLTVIGLALIHPLFAVPVITDFHIYIWQLPRLFYYRLTHLSRCR